MADQEYIINALDRDRWMASQGARYVGQSGHALIWKNDTGTTYTVWSDGPGRLRVVVKAARCAC